MLIRLYLWWWRQQVQTCKLWSLYTETKSISWWIPRFWDYVGASSKCGAEQVVDTRPCGCVTDIYLQTTSAFLTICHQRSILVTKCCIPGLHGVNEHTHTVKMNSLRQWQMHVGHVVWRTALITCKDRRLLCFKLARLSFSKEIRWIYKDDPSADGAADFTQWSQRKYNQEFKRFTAKNILQLSDRSINDNELHECKNTCLTVFLSRSPRPFTC